MHPIRMEDGASHLAASGKVPTFLSPLLPHLPIPRQRPGPAATLISASACCGLPLGCPISPCLSPLTHVAGAGTAAGSWLWVLLRI